MLSPVLDIGVVGTVNKRTKTVPLQSLLSRGRHTVNLIKRLVLSFQCYLRQTGTCTRSVGH